VFEPREYPEYAAGYYAVFVEDPDGSRWEFLHAPNPV
jgi:predicted lactoylglutathione lyase